MCLLCRGDQRRGDQVPLLRVDALRAFPRGRCGAPRRVRFPRHRVPAGAVPERRELSMTRWLISVGAALWLALPAVAFSANGALIAATLKDEASECRYLLRLCAQTEVEPGTLYELLDAAHVIREKHEKMPECFKKCS